MERLLGGAFTLGTSRLVFFATVTPVTDAKKNEALHFDFFFLVLLFFCIFGLS